MNEINKEVGISMNEAWFQQDGNPSHTSKKIMNYLKTKFGDRVISNKTHGSIPWAPRSAELSLLDFTVWAVVKDRVYKNRDFTNVEDLYKAIQYECQEIEKSGMLENML